MRDLIDVKGASGAVYRFTRFRVGNPLSAMGGNFIYVRQKAERYEVIYANEAQNLLTDARRLWDQAVREYSAEGLYIRLNIAQNVRQREHDDIVNASEPPMNATERSQSSS
jgi:hypothetical protein